MRIGSRLAKLAISDIRAMTIACQAKGGINLGQGVCDLPTPEPVARGAIRAIEDHIATYAHPMGIAELRQAVARKVETLYGVSYDPSSEVVITSGATGGFAASILALCEPGDEIILFEPYYGYHLNTVLSLGLVPVLVPLVPPTWQIEREALERAVTSKTRAIVICTPSNPGGKVLSEAERELLADFCQSHNLIAFCDEIYEHIVFDGKRHVPLQQLPQMRSRCVTLTGLSKTFSITGWRLGYVQAAPEVIAQARKVHDFLTVGAAAPLQHAVVTALNFPAEYYAGLAAEYAESRDVLLSYLDRTGLAYSRPEGAYFVMVDISPFGYASDVEFAHWMTKEIGVAPVPGSSFFANGENRYIRLNFAKRPATLHAAGERLLKLRRG